MSEGSADDASTELPFMVKVEDPTWTATSTAFKLMVQQVELVELVYQKVAQLSMEGGDSGKKANAS